jgi:hypothetical protein
MHTAFVVSVLVAGLSLASAAEAAIVAFTGNVVNSTPLIFPAAGCPGGALISVNPGNSTQTTSSNFGSFGISISHCVAFPPIPPFSFTGGVFGFGFAGGSLTGSYSGDVTPTANPAVVNNITNYLVTGGTGKFAGASGIFTATGTLELASGLNINTQAISGTINAPAVPEPATWAMLIAGFGLVGGMQRRRRDGLISVSKG